MLGQSSSTAGVQINAEHQTVLATPPLPTSSTPSLRKVRVGVGVGGERLENPSLGFQHSPDGLRPPRQASKAVLSPTTPTHLLRSQHKSGKELPLQEAALESPSLWRREQTPVSNCFIYKSGNYI